MSVVPPTCPGCGTEHAPGDAYCGACGLGIGAVAVTTRHVESEPALPTVATSPAVDTSPTVPTPATSAATPFAIEPGTDLRVFPWWQIIVFGILSLGSWSFYWFYCTRKQLNQILRADNAHPGQDTVGLAVPIWQVWSVNGIFRDVGQIARFTQTGTINNTAYSILWTVFYYVPIVNYLSVIVIPILYCITQSRLSRSLSSLAGGPPGDKPVTVWSAVIGMVPTVLLVLVLFAV